ncbi:hypothetical protein LTR27_000850 [Elasticomyces elasticus]|nr:hypothetical protein LTR27_000850 [Elasticomyces elasticus]
MSAPCDSVPCVRDSRIHFLQTHHEFQQLGSGANGIACLAAKKNANDQQAQISGVRAPPPSRQVDPTRLIVVKYYTDNDDPDEPGDLCNEIAIMKTFGGTLQDFINTAAKKAPMAFVWHVAHSITASLLFMYFGITSVDASGNAVTEPRWPPITHNDIHNGNIYLGLAPAAAEYKHSNFPLVVLADFGHSKSHSDYAEFVDTAKDDVGSLSTIVIRRLCDATDGEYSQELEDWMEKCDPNILSSDEAFNVSTKEFLLDLLKTAVTERRK